MQEKIIQYFKEISQIPRPSMHEERVREYLVRWAEWKWLEYKIDKGGNTIIYVPAKNNNSWKTVILQWHIDMVCVKDDWVDHDFMKDPIDVYEENGFLKARGTTLGSDNAIGVATAMTLVDLDSHPALELFFTVDEEQGLVGVRNMDWSLLRGTYMINIDNEDMGQIFLASAWGIRMDLSGKVETTQATLPQYKVHISGSSGWHSWADIHKVTANPIVGLMHFLQRYKWNFEIASINSWVADNAIPVGIKAVLWIENVNHFRTALEIFTEKYKTYHNQPNIELSISEEKNQQEVLKYPSKIISFVTTIPVGVLKMSSVFHWKVESSNNIWIIDLQWSSFRLTSLMRSFDNNSLDAFEAFIRKHTADNNFTFYTNGGYGGWQEDPNSPFVSLVHKCYEEVYKKPVKIEAIHAWLECGMIKNALGGNVEIVSIGPNIFEAHTTSERCEISTIWPIFEIIKKVLQSV